MTFDQIFDRVVGNEGGYVNNPNDPGWETNWGISKREYPELDIKNLTRDQARTIYFRDFWAPIQADGLQDPVAFQVFDFAFNSGISTAIRYLQRAVGVADDGHWGPQSQAAAEKLSGPDLIMRLLAERLDYMTKLSGWPAFGKGWASRIAQDLRFASQDI